MANLTISAIWSMACIALFWWVDRRHQKTRRKTRPLREMLNEHKADPKKGPHIEAARRAMEVPACRHPESLAAADKVCIFYPRCECGRS